MKKPNENDIAIVGIACQFPDAIDYNQFWNNLILGKNSIKEIPADRWKVSEFYSNNIKNKEKSISKWCGIVEDIKSFDNEFFNISPLEAINMDPQQRLLLQQSWRCIEDSAIPLRVLQKFKTSVFVGAMTSDYLQTLNKNKDANNRYSILGNDHCILANRISHQFNLSGESISINATSASSLVAIHKAKSSLVLGECDFAIAAGVSLNIDPFKYIVFTQAGMLSPDGQCKSFSDDANGYVPGDGVAALLLQPLSKAIKNNNYIYGVIKGSAINHIGSGKAITAPCVDAQTRVILEALNNAQRNITDVGYIEAHGSGTPLGDPIEIEAINRVFKNTDSPVIIGSVKPNIGHLEAASGIAGVIKGLLVLKHKYIPENLNLNKVNPIFNLKKSKIKLATGDKLNHKNQSCIGVSSFGFGGVSCHLVLEGFDNKNNLSKQSLTKNNPIHFILSAKSQTSLKNSIKQWSDYLKISQEQHLDFKDICSSVTTGREQFPHRIGFVLQNKAELIKSLKNLSLTNNQISKQPLSIIFADVSSCTLNTNVALISHNYQALIKKVEGLCRNKVREGVSLLRRDSFNETLLSVAIFRTLQLLDIQPSLIEATPKGVWAALLSSEIIRLEDYLDVVLERRNVSEISFYRPKLPFKFSCKKNTILPKYINNKFILNFFREIKTNYKDCINIVEKANTLLNSNEVFKDLLSEWNLPNKNKHYLFDTIQNFSKFFSTNINRVAYAVVAANVCLNHFYKKWMFECENSQHSYYITTFSSLVCHKMLSKSDFYLISTNQHSHIEKCLSNLNNDHWCEINKLVCDKQKYSHRELIAEKKLFISGIENNDIAISENRNNIQSISLGCVDKNDHKMIQYEISTIFQWQDSLLSLWINGHDIYWDILYPQSNFKRLPLPGYAFDKVKFWVSEINTKKNKLKEKHQVSVVKEKRDSSKSFYNSKKKSLDEITKLVKTIFSTLLQLDETKLDMQKNFDAYGLDSIGYTQLSEQINDIYAISLTPACFYSFKNIKKLIECIENRLHENNKEFKSEEKLKAVSISKERDISDVAIVGYSGILPNAKTLDEFWNNISKGIDGISKIPKSRWDWKDYYSLNLKDENRTPSKWGGFIDDIECFDAAFFGISPQEAKLMDPQQRIVLQMVWQAIEHSGHKPSSLGGTNTGVFIGASTSDYEELVREYNLAAHASTGMNRSIIANRVSFLLDIHGPSEIIDTACSSSLVAIHKAVESIKQGRCKLAIAGGVNAIITPTHYISYGKAGMLSPDGQCKTFDEEANGYVRGEGAGVIILKPLTQAKKDNDTIHAIIKASGTNHGGRARSLTAPNPNAQAALIYDTYEKAEINSHSIDYIETHGTGTPLGDPIEINGLMKAFDKLESSENNQQRRYKCYLASVKSNIGHLEAAAGIASVLKVILSLKNEMLPASQNLRKINPYIKFAKDRFEILQQNRPWLKNDTKRKRRAGISSFGFGGVNAHIVIEEYNNKDNDDNDRQENLIILSAKSKNALNHYAKNYLNYLNDINFTDSLTNIAYTLQVGRNDEEFRLAIWAADLTQLISGLNSYIKNNSENYAFSIAREINQEDSQEIQREKLSRLLLKKKLKKLGKLWVRGIKVNWSKLHKNQKNLQRIALPTYPYQKKRFWIKDDYPNQTTMKSISKNNLSENFIKKISKDSYIANEHIVNGRAISPGVYSLELLYSALARNGTNFKDIILKDVFFRESIPFHGDDVILSINTKRFKKDRLLEIHVIDSKDKVNSIIVTQAIVIQQSKATNKNNFPSLIDFRSIDIENLYFQLKIIGFDYGPSFRVIKNIAHHSGRFIARLSLKGQINDEKYTIDPRLLDGSLQACLGCLLYSNIQGLYIPMMIEKVRVTSKLPTTAFAYISPKQALDAKQDSYAFDIRIVDETNHVLVEFNRIIFKRFKQSDHQLQIQAHQANNNSTRLNSAPLIKKSISPLMAAVAQKGNEPSFSNNSKNNNKMENYKMNTKVLSKKTIEYFLSIIAETASLEKNEIDIKKPFKEYGIDSFLTLSVIRNLEDDFGELRKTLLFEASNIQELSAIFINEYEETLIKLFNLKVQEVNTDKVTLNNLFGQQTSEKNKSIEGNSKEEDNKIGRYHVLFEDKLKDNSSLAEAVKNLFSKYGGESIALSRKDIAPQIFMCSTRKGLFYFNINKTVLLAFRYVGSTNYFTKALSELEQYCVSQKLQMNVLCEITLEPNNESNISGNTFGVVQRIKDLSAFTINGSKMRRLRYQVNKFQKLGQCQTFEYSHGSDSAKDDAIASMIEKWADNKSGVNPYIWRVKDEMETGCMGNDYRVFLTYLDKTLQNVIIISRIESDNSYLLDTEFYPTDMAMGAMEYAICEIMQILKTEGCSAFSLGLTFGSRFHQATHFDPAVAETLEKLAEDKIFEESGNFQFKNKYRCQNSPLYLYRAMGQSSANIIDIIMMIGNPLSINNERAKLYPVENNSRVTTTNNLTNDYHVQSITKGITGELTTNKVDHTNELQAAGYNPFNISRQDIEYDLATDSWSELEYDFINERTQKLQLINNRNEQQLESLLTGIFSLPYILPFASGRVAESFFCPAWPIRKKYILQNVLFPTCLFHQINNDFFPIEVTNSEFYNRHSNYLFKGNIDCDLLKEKLKEHEGDIAYVWVELANNASGGCSVSMSNLKEIKSVIGSIPMVLDATRIIENAYHIQECEEQYKEWDIWKIVKEICSYADAINASLTKDFGTHTGGFIATRDEKLYAQMQDAVSTNGSGLSRSDRKLICNALNDKEYILSMVKQRMDVVLELAKTLINIDMTVVQPVGGHCILIDPMSIEGFSQLDLPLPSFLAWLYKNTSIRAGIHSVGRQRNTSMNDLIRLAIPLGVNHKQIDEIGKRITSLLNTTSTIDNLELKNKPQGLFGDVKANYISLNGLKLNLSSSEKTSTIDASMIEAGSAKIADKYSAKNKPNRKSQVGEIAVIGMSGRYPDAINLEQFWHNLCDGNNSIKLGPDWQGRFIEKNTEQHLGGFINDVDKFDSLFFNISPREAENMDPQERLMMEVSWEALEDAGYYPESLCSLIKSNKVGVFIGAVWSYYEMLGAENRQFGGNSLANSQHWGISNRISSFMNFSGPSLTVDTACSSSLTAIHLACESIRNGECKVALAGGINLDLHPSKHHITKAAQFLSEDGQCRAFGKGGTGYVAGEGVGTLILKPLSAAIKDGDHIYGVIKSTVTNHGGRTAGYTVPSPNAQADLISSAISKAKISANSISYIEAHGTGTQLGDPVEIQGATKAFREGTDKKQYCAIGSVKTNIGHLEAAAGIAGATKLLLQLKHKKLVPSLHSTELNEYIDFKNSPFYVQQSNEFWQPIEIDGKMTPRRAGLSSFGAGGTNVHIIFEEYQVTSSSLTSDQSQDKEQLIILSAKNDERLKCHVKNLLTYLQQTPITEVEFNNLAYTLQIGRLPMAKRIAILAENGSQLIQQLKYFLDGKDDDNLYLTDPASQLALDIFDGEESKNIIKILADNGSYNKLAKLWVNGIEVNWVMAMKDNKSLRISLPTYPFAKESHWIEVLSASNNLVDSLKNKAKGIHPLLDSNCSSFKQLEFVKQFNLDQFIFSDHIVDNLPTLPGVAYMEMAIAAVQHAMGCKIYTLKNLVWASPINSLSPQEIRIILNKKSDVVNFEICTFGDSKEKNIHAQGKVDYQPQSEILPVLKKDLNAIKNRCLGSMTKDECYTLLNTRKLSYGDKLQTITGFQYGQKEGLTCLELPTGLKATFNDYTAHPSILDGAVQSIICLLEHTSSQTQADVPYVPFVLKELMLIKTCTHKCYAHLTLVVGQKERDDIKKINIDILDESGQVLLQMKEFSFKAISEEVGLRASNKEINKYSLLTQDNVVLYSPSWKLTSQIKDNNQIDGYISSLEDSIILFDNNQDNKTELQNAITTGSGAAVVILVESSNSFVKINRQHYQLCTNNADHYQLLIDSLLTDEYVPNKFIHNLSTHSYIPEKKAMDQNINNGLLSVFLLSQSLLKNKKSIGSKKLNFTYIYHTNSNNSQPLYSSVNGLFRSIKQEGAAINCKTICLNNDATDRIKKIEWAQILIEQDNSDQEVSIKNNQRFVKQLAAINVNNKNSKNIVQISKPEGVYLITGGVGGLGMIFAKELASKAKIKLVLTGRTSFDEAIKAKINDLEKISSSVLYIKCDLTVQKNVEKLIAKVIAKYGKVDGIIHAAGIIKDGFLWNKKTEVYKQVIAPKIFGAQNLDNATKDINLDYFIMCSSIASVHGNMGQSDYAAANRYMDDFARLRTQWHKQGKRNGKTLSVNWPLWRDGGMQVNEQAEKWLLENWGMIPLTTRIGLEALNFGLNQEALNFGLVEGDAEKIYSALSIEKPSIEKHEEEILSEANSETLSLNNKISQISSINFVASNKETIQEKLQTDLTQIVIELIKIKESDIEFTDNMSTYGFDSITFTDFSNQINTKLEIEVTPLIFFEQETLEELTQYLLEDFSESLALHYKCNSVAEVPDNFVEPSYVTTEEEIDSEVNEELSEEKTFKDDIDEQTEDKLVDDNKENISEPIAIIGMSGIMPQSPDLDIFWDNLVNEKNLVTEIPKDRWDWKKYFGESDLGNSKTKIKWGGFIPEIDKFDADFFKISPLEAELTDPQQRLFLETVWHTIEDSGYKASELSGTNTGVFVGIGTSDYHELLREQNNDFEAYSVMGWMHAVLANRISYFFNWSGPSEPIGTACSSSLVALDRAIQAIRSKKCEMCIAGGISLIINPGLHIGLGKAGMLSPDGRCKTFDQGANGYVRSEGVGALLLKPLSKAKADNDNIYAVIKGSAVNHGGHVNTFTTPNPKAQTAVMTMAYDDAKIDPATLTYIEAHGTGTALGDPIEVQGLLNAFKNRANKTQEIHKLKEYCSIGSVKTNVGHLELAAGMAGLFKLILSLKNRIIPATINFDEINPYIKLDDTPFRVATSTQKWKQISSQNGRLIPRRAGISSFGFGGVNAHIILEEYNPNIQNSSESNSTQIIILSTKYKEGLIAYANKLQAYIMNKESDNLLPDLATLASGLQFGRESMSYRLSFVVKNYNDLKKQLADYCNGNIENYFSNITNKTKGSNLQSIDVKTLLFRNDFNAIAENWVLGGSIEWQELCSRKIKISLPNYPFQKNRYWLVDDTEKSITESDQLIEKSTISDEGIYIDLIPNDNNKSKINKFNIRFNQNCQYLQDHEISNLHLLPAATYLEIVTYCIGEIMVFDRLSLRNINWLSPITNKDTKDNFVLTIEKNNDLYNFMIQSKSSDKIAKNYCQGMFKIDNEIKKQNDSLNEKNFKNGEVIDRNTCYENFQGRGFNYGRSLKVIDRIYINNNEALVYLKLPNCFDEIGANTLHTSIIDGALQGVLGLLIATVSENKIQVPISSSSVVFHRPITGNSFAHIKEIQNIVSIVGKRESKDSRIFDIKIYNDNHELSLSISKIEIKSIQKSNNIQALDVNKPNETINFSQVKINSLTIEYLVQMVAKETKRESSSIEATTSFDSYGIDSFLALRMTKKLEKAIGPVDKTAFFEYTTIQSLSGYLISQYTAELNRLFQLEALIPIQNKQTTQNVTQLDAETKPIENSNTLLSNTIEYLTQMVAKETKRESSSIEATTSFDSYGIDSFLALRMTKKLEKAIGPVDKTAFFEYTTIQSLSGYLISQYTAELNRLFQLEALIPIQNKQTTQNVTQLDAETKPIESSNTLLSNTIEYLTQMVAKETKRESSSIEATTSFDSYGIDSFLALRMTKKLEKAIGSIDKTAFFEYTNINTLAKFLIDKHTHGLSDFFNINKVKKNFEKEIETKKSEECYQIFLEKEIINNSQVKNIIDNLNKDFGNENNALARNAIAPMVFLSANNNAYFNFNKNDDLALAFTYVGPNSELKHLVKEFSNYCETNRLQPNILTEMPIKSVNGKKFSSNPFGMMQRLYDIDALSLQGGKMRRLRYQVSKFQASGECSFEEYSNGKNQQIDKSIVDMIDRWSATKKMINPYIWKVKKDISIGVLPKEHRIFITRVNGELQNVIIITKLASQLGYLMDLEFYDSNMPLGGLEYSIWNILQQLKHENFKIFSLGATFGVVNTNNDDYSNPKVTSLLVSLQQQGAFDGQGNLQFKNKFRPTNSIVFLARPYDDDPNKIIDVILMIANPFLESSVPAAAL